MIKVYKIQYLRYSIFIFICILLQLNQSCSGSSPSGRRSNNKNVSKDAKNYERDDNTGVIKTKSERRTTKNDNLSLSELYNKYKQSVFLVYTSDGDKKYQGSGFFVSKNGLAISNYHVFQGKLKGKEQITTLDQKMFKIKEVLDKSEKHDYIIFKVDIGSYEINHPLTISRKAPKVGEDVFSIGNPRGLESTLSKGIISSLRANNTILQTTTEITHGSSGGPLLNKKGEVIGITSSGLGEANLNFATNIKDLNLKRFLRSKRNNSKESDLYNVTKVVDGDTFWVDDGSKKGLKVRLIGVDTPETVHPRKPVQYYGKEASNYVKSLLKGNKIRLKFGVDKFDRYGRVLAYVYLEDGTFLNANLVKNGFAQVSTFPPNVKYADQFKSLQQEARKQDKGLWKKQ